MTADTHHERLIKALVLIRQLREQNQHLERALHEPIAVIGLGCRFPGGESPEAFWQSLRAGVDAVREIPRERWDADAYYDPDPAAPGKMYTRQGSFLDGIDKFDARFFGIAPREAVGLDPQHRLLLEVSWEALEHAGLAVDQLAGSRTGVFLGICGSDYAQLLARGGLNSIDAYLGTGTAVSVAAGRLSYALGFQGPCVALDTACSSSLVAVSQACDSLRAGRCDLALAAGVNVILSPQTSINFSKAQMLAPDGRCKTFDASADGYGRGEGCGVVVLRRLSDALRLGDPVQAVIRGSAVNQDGHSQGLTAPNGPAQQRVIAEALANAGLQPRDIQYVEAHGTGTVLGDPIEVQALAAALCGDRLPDRPLLIGSVKTNIGHLEGAAGIAALIKVILCLQHGEIPPHLHVRQPNPHIPWDRLPVRVTRERTIWTAADAHRIAGVSAFGASGTNAHVVLEEAPAAPSNTEAAPERTHHVLTLSAKTGLALQELAERYAAWLDGRSAEDLANACFTANAGRSHFEHRAALVCASPAQARSQLTALARGDETPMLFRGECRLKPKVAFLFTGQGASYAGLVRSLYDAQPVFRAALDRCAGILEGVPDLPLRDMHLLDALSSDRAMSQARYLQPAMFAVAYGLTELWRAWGVEPDAVLGHSLGEYAAACAAGVLPVETGLRLVAERGRLMQTLPPGGAMAAVFGERDAIADVLADSSLSMAADNGSHVVLSGPAASLGKALDELRLRGCVSSTLEVSHAFHSALVEPILADLDRAARSVQHETARLPLVLDRTGDVLQEGQSLEPGYWAQHARQPVQFSRSIKALAGLGCTVLLEIGPSPVLLGLAQHSWPPDSAPPAMLPSLRRGRGDQEQIAESLARLYVGGVTPDFAGFDRPWQRRKLSLPTYPFQRRRFWVDNAPKQSEAAQAAHPFLGNRVRLASGEDAWTLHLSRESQPYLAAHSLDGMVIVPGSLYAALAIAAYGIPCGLRDLVIAEPLSLEPQAGLTVQLVFSAPGENSSQNFQIFSAATGALEESWTLHARGSVHPSTPPSSPVDVSVAELRAGLAPEAISGSRLETLWRGAGEALGEVVFSGESADAPVAPAVLDAIFQTAAIAAEDRESSGDLFLLLQIARLDLFEALPQRLFCHARRKTQPSPGSETRSADVRLLDEAGRMLGEVRGFVLKRVDPAGISHLPRPDFSRWLYQIEWRNKPHAGRSAVADFLAEPQTIAANEAAVPAAQAMAGLEHASELSAGLDQLSLLYVIEALGKLGWHPGVGEVIEPAQSARRLGIHPRYLRLFRRLLQILAEEGLLAADESGWTVCRTFPPGDSTQMLAALLQRLPAGRIELNLVGRCGRQLAGILQGNVDPLGLLFPQDGIDGAEQLYHESPVVRAVNGAAGRAFAKAIEKLTPDRRLRVLEIGAGTGGTTAGLLPLAPADQTDYVFTDVSASFFPAAERRFAEYPFVSCRVLDIERDPLQQGFAAHGYDVVIAANVLHATADLPRTLEHVRRLLAPGGLLLLVEATTRQRWLDLTFGLLEGWWKFDDSVRSDYPLLSVAQWTDLLGARGFGSVAAFSPGGQASTQTVLMSRGPLEVAMPVAVLPPGAWLILADAGGLGNALAAKLRALGQHVVVAEPGERAIVDGTPLVGVVHLRALDAQPAADSTVESLRADIRHSCASVLSLSQSLNKSGPLTGFWLVTRGAQAVEGPGSPAIAQAPLVGLGKALALEQPELKCRRIDLDPQPGAHEADELLEMLLSADGIEDEVAIRGVRCLAPRLAPLSPPDQLVPDRLDPEASWLITGGLGALGLEVARWLAGRGARHLILMGRNVPGEGAEAVIHDLRSAGCEVRAVQADVTREQELAAALARIAAEMPPLRGVVHAAGVFDDDVLLHQTWDRFEVTLAPKVAGAWNLHRQTLQLPLDFFILFSSYASVVGLVGGANYTAGNAFLDVLAHYRRSLGLPALSVNWGPWSGGGMAAVRTQRDDKVRPQRDDKWWKVPGLQLMAPGDALGALELLCRLGQAQATVLRADWAVVARSSQLARQLPVLSDLLPAAKRQTRAADPLPLRLEGAPPAERHRLLRKHVRDTVAQVLRLDAQELDDERGFFDQGMDSLMAVELRNRLQAEAGGACELSSTLIFDQPTVAALSDYLATTLLGAPAAETKPQPRVNAVHENEPIAIIGLSCRFPGADGPEAFWQLLRDGVDAVREVPPERWDVDAYFDPDPDAVGKMYMRQGAFLNGADRFDPYFFGISPREAAGIDPQHRLLLEVAWETLERAGLPPGRLAGSRTGVFIGINGSDYATIAAAAGAADREIHFAAGIAPNAAAGRLAYTLGLQGPAMAIDTACSSSLVAVHQACQSLGAGECDSALAGGVSLMLSPLPAVTMSRSRMLSPDGRSKSFDASADGFGRGEGCGLVLLKRLADARRDGDTVLALIDGSAVNQDGRSSGLTVPNGAAQENLITDALSRAGISAASVQYVEAHGTGTALGDPIEVRALGAAFGVDRPQDQPLLIGSVKTNIGHLEAAAGIAGLIKVVLSLQHREIPPQLHFRHPSPHIPWKRLAVRVVTERTRWPEVEGSRIAGVSSFGFSGTNAHVVLQEAPAAAVVEQNAPPRPAHVLTLSAKSEAALLELAERYARWLEGRSTDDLANACFAANTGRTHFEHRAAMVCSSPEQARAQLSALARGEEAAGLFRGHVRSKPRVAFLFTGEEAHYPAPARELCIDQPVFRTAFNRCAEVLRPVLNRSLEDALRGDEMFWQDAECAQPALFALAHALTELWGSWGVKPDMVMGHGVGEYAAACAAGNLSIEDGLRLARTERARHPVQGANRVAGPAETDGQVIIEIGPSEPLAESLARIYVAGVTPDWSAWDWPWARRSVTLPTYPFQRERCWVASSAHLLGRKHGSASGEVVYADRLDLETQPYLADHQVLDTVIAPGAYYMALALSAGGVPCQLRDIEFAEPLVLVRGIGRDVQLVLGEPRNGDGRAFQVFSAAGSEGPWTLHARGTVAGLDRALAEPEMALPKPATPLDVEELYAAFARRGVSYGPAFHGIEAAWAASGEARGRIALPQSETRPPDAVVHPALLDACLQVTAAAMGQDSEDLFVPLQIEQVWLNGPLGRDCWCHAKLRSRAEDSAETVTADLTITDESGGTLGRIEGLVLKRTDRAVLFREQGAATSDWLYETRWREADLPASAQAVDFLPQYFAAGDAAGAEVVPAIVAQAADLDRLSRQYALAALQNLGWRPQPNEVVDAESIAERLGVGTRHRRLLGRIFEMFSEEGWLEPHRNGGGMSLQVGHILPVANPDALYNELSERQPGNRLELAVLARCGARLDEVLTGRLEPLGLLFPASGGGAAELYHQSPVARLLNGLTSRLMAQVASALPDGRQLRVLEVGAGTGGTTASVLPELPLDRTAYDYTDLSAGFLSAAQERFASWPYLRYRAFNVEEDPATQGLPVQGYDVVIAAQALHAVVDLPRALRHLRSLLAPGGLLVLVEGFRRQAWLDLTFGLLHGWWQFDDAWRHDYPLLDRERWLRLLAAEGFEATAALSPPGLEEEQAVLLARAPRVDASAASAFAPGGVWLVFADRAGLGAELTRRLAARNQSCVLIEPPLEAPAFARSLDEALPAGASLAGVLYLWGLDAELEICCAGALHLAQALARSGREPASGLWLLTRSAQAVGSADRPMALDQAPLWGLGRVIAQEHPELRCRMLDLDGEGSNDEAGQIVAELLAGEAEDQLALRGNRRHVLRLTRWPEPGRLEMPAGSCALNQESPGNLDGLSLKKVEARPPEAGEVQLRVKAAGLNFRDVLNALGMYPGEAAPLGSEFAGEVTAAGPGVEGWRVGDAAFGFAPGAFAATVTVPAAFIAPKPARLTFNEAAGVPIAFSTAELAWERALLRAGDVVLVHSGAGGVGLAAVQLARRMGAQVWATASLAKHEYLRSIGVRHVFDSRSLDFAGQVRIASGGRGVDVVLNSLSGEGYIAATLSTLAAGGRFVEIGRRGIWTKEEIARARPDVEYSVLALNDTLRDSPEETSRLLAWLASALATGELEPLRSEVFPLAEVPAAFRRMQAGKHIGKIVLRMPLLAGLEPAGPVANEPGTYLITGGLGGLGLEVSRWLAGQGIRHLALLGRRPPNSTAEAAVARLRQDGCAVRVFQADVSQAADIEGVLQEIERSMPPLRGVFHAAGILDDGAVVNQTWERFQTVTAAKIQGARHLDRLTAGRPLSCFVMFSSMASVLGSPGQSNHGAANAFLDALAWDRRRRGLPGISINWGAWSGVGAAAKPELQARWAEQGIGLIAPEQGLAVLQRVMAEEPTQVGVLPVDWRKLERHHGGRSSPPLLTEILMRAGGKTTGGTELGGALRQRLAQTVPEQRHELLVSLVQDEAAQVLHLDASHRPEPRQGFTDMGMDSLMSVEMRNRLQKQIALDPPLSATALFDYPTIEALARHLAERVAPLLETGPVSTQHRPPVRPPVNEPIAIIGLGCRMPGAADPQAFWRLLREGVDAVSEVPANRWDIDACYDPDPDAPGGICSRFGGFLSDIDLFDAGFFGISGREAEALDPQQRLLLEVTWEALEHAGLAAAKLAGSRTGVFIGISTTDYGQRLLARGPASIGAYMGTGLAHSVAAGRLSYFLGLHGPCLALDTACSSSLVAVSQACDSLHNAQCELALAGGVNVILSPELSINFTKARMLAPDGRSKTFDDAADGFARGEGCGVVVLKRLSDAQRDRDPILAVVRAAAVNQDGRSSGLTTPNGPVQQRVIREALDLAGVAPAEVQYVETHGTGTALGDPIEVQALAAALGDGRPEDRPLLIGSVKTNIGHLEAAAGIAGLIKVVLSLQNEEIPPHLHFRRPNRHIPWERLPVRVTSEGVAWKAGKGRRVAGVSSFGLGGTNAHVLLEEAPHEAAGVAPRRPERSRHVLCLSGGSAAALREVAHRYAQWFAENPKADLADVCFTANTGRNHFGFRAALIVETCEQARKQLSALAAGEPADDAQPPEDDLARTAEELVRQYLSGATPDWEAWDQPWPRRKVALPTYPFQRQSYWVESVPSPEPRRDDVHPLLGHRQRSAVSGEVVHTTLVGAARPAFLQDHKVFGEVMAPGAFYAAMAVAAAGLPCRLESILFPEPLLLEDKKTRTLQLVLTRPGSAEMQLFQILSAANADTDDWTLHARGEIRRSASSPSTDAPGETLDALRQSLRPMPPAELYSRLEASGIKHGPSFRRLEALWAGDGAALGEISGAVESGLAGTPIHPAVLDCCFQVMAGGLVPDQQGPWALARIERLELFNPIPSKFFCVARMRSFSDSEDTFVADFDLLDRQSRRLGRVEGLVARRLGQQGLRRSSGSSDWFYRMLWKERPLPVATQPRPLKGEVWLVFADAGGLGNRLADILRRQGRDCVCVSAGDDYEWPADAPLAGVVYLKALDAAPHVEAAVELACDGVLQLVQALSRRQLRPAFGLWLLTRSAQMVDGDEEPLALAQAAVWGLGRVVAQEHPELRCRLMDLDPVESASDIEQIVAELLANDTEDQLSLRGGSRLALRLTRWPESGRLETPGGYSQLHQTHSGSLDGLRLRHLDPRPPGRGGVQIHVRAAGLNFRDVLNALGLYPGDAGLLGGECAGEVTAVGPGVEDFQIGDAVFGFGDGTLAGTVTTQAVLLARMPEGLTFNQLAGAPTAFATAWLALEQAGLRAGDRILIHAAAGGVGLAAVQVAQLHGAEVFATASLGKHAYLRSLNVQHVFNSRSTDFSAQVRSATGGKGVDVVLNSLSGEGYIAASLNTLAEGGRFVEIGKRGVWTAAEVSALRPDVKYSVLALDEVMREPQKAGVVLKQVAEALASGELKPLRHHVYPLAEAPAAFRRMQAGRNIGKLILRMPALPKAGQEGTYLVTGGLGGLGLEVVRWLARSGARRIAIMGRRPPDSSAAAALAELRQQGCTLLVFEGDVSRACDLEAMLGEVKRTMPPLRGVFHAAGVMDDGALINLNRDRFRTVLAAKVQGAWLLDRLTSGCELDCFVLFSSMASVLGSPGQGNYAAANAFLDALAHDRRRRGLPGISINWGAWKQVGAAANPELQARLRQQGVGLIPPAEGIAALERIVREEPAQIGVLPVDWKRLGIRPLFEEILAPESSPRAASSFLKSAEELSHLLVEAEPEQRQGIATMFVQQTAARILGLDSSAVGANQNLHAKGLDSLMAVEMRNDLSAATGHTLPATLLYDYPTPAAAADYLLMEVLKLEPSSQDSVSALSRPQPAATAIPPVVGVGVLDALSDDELESLLDSKLAEVLGRRETP